MIDKTGIVHRRKGNWTIIPNRMYVFQFMNSLEIILEQLADDFISQLRCLCIVLSELHDRQGSYPIAMSMYLKLKQGVIFSRLLLYVLGTSSERRVRGTR